MNFYSDGHVPEMSDCNNSPVNKKSGPIAKKDILSVQDMIPFLFHDISNKIFIYETLGSTNLTAKENTRSGTEHGTVIIANSQTAGKGRYGKTFHSPPDHGLYMSMILHSTRLYFNDPVLLTIYAAVAVCEAIESLSGKSPQIKWVNDIIFNGKKICGILTEATADQNDPDAQWLILGIGINFSTPASNFPEELKEKAGSVFDTEKSAVTRNHLAAEIINRIIFSENQYKDDEIIIKYKQKMFLLGKEISVTEGKNVYNAVAVDIDSTGRLVIKKADGESKSLSAGEISIKK